MRLFPILAVALSLALPAGAETEPDRGDGDSFASGYEAYVAGRFDEALALWLPLAEGSDPRAQFNIGVLYASGLGVPKDMAIAMDWWERAARQLHARAAHNLALAILANEPDRVPDAVPDYAAALRWLKIGVDAGYANSQYTMGKLTAEGLGVEADAAAAANFYLLAARQGFARAQYNLGKIYRDGIGVAQDETLSLFWWREAAERGDRMAQDKMGDRIMRGAGIEADPVEALKWTLLAARQKVQASEERRFTLIASLPQDQIEEAIRRADAFSPKRGPVDAVPGETLEPQ
jgi:uncharacterized protein